MKALRVLLFLAALPAAAQRIPNPSQPTVPQCHLDRMADNGTGISCTGIEWPPLPKKNEPPSGTVNAKPLTNKRGQREVSKPYRNTGGRLCVQEVGIERCLGDPEIPKVGFREVADRKFWATVALDAAMAAYVVEGLQHCRHVDPKCREANPVLGQSRGQQYAAKIGLTVVIPAVGKYYWRKWDMQDKRLGYNNHTPGWWLPAIIAPVANFVDGSFAWRHRPHTSR